MATIITGANGTLAYFNAKPHAEDTPAFGIMGEFNRPVEIAFARLSAFTTNSNHRPSELGGAISWDAGIDLLFRIADAR